MIVRKLKILLRRIKSMSLKRMFNVINAVHILYGANRVRVFFDMIFCAFKYSVGYLDYMVFGFAKIKGKKKRSTFMTMNHNLSLVRQKNDKNCVEIFNDKILFNETFKQFIGRDFIDLRNSDANKLEKFLQGKEFVFVKKTHTFGGQGIEKLKVADVCDYNQLYSELTENGQYLVEDAICQHEKINSLCASSVNTIRMVTVINDGKAVFMYAVLRIGNGKGDVDNISSGGMYAPVNDEGVVTKPAFCDKQLKYFDVHPVTNQKIVGFEIPYFKEAVQMCKDAALVEKRMGYVGWDVAITATGPVLVEGNNFPSYDMVQNYGHIENDTGIRPKFEKTLGIKL